MKFKQKIKTLIQINYYNGINIVLIFIIFVFATIFHLFIPTVVFFSLLFVSLNCLFIRKPTDKEWELFRSLECWHFTSSENSNKIDCKDGNIYLKRSRNPFVNSSILFRPAIYFFYTPPSQTNKKNNLWGKDSSTKVSVKIENLKREHLRLRKLDNTLIYLYEDYFGPGKIEKDNIF